jgi:hypothetical protein
MVVDSLNDIDSFRAIKVELAGRLVDQSNVPLRALQGIFVQAMQAIAGTVGSFNQPIYNQVWERVAPTRLSVLREICVQEVCGRLFVGLPNAELPLMLAEHRRICQILRIHELFYANVTQAQMGIEECVQTEAQRLIPRMFQEMQLALTAAVSEGVGSALFPQQQVL